MDLHCLAVFEFGCARLRANVDRDSNACIDGFRIYKSRATGDGCTPWLFGNKLPL